MNKATLLPSPCAPPVKPDRLEVITSTYGRSRSTQRQMRPFLSASIEFLLNTVSYRLRPLEYHSRQPDFGRFDPFAARRANGHYLRNPAGRNRREADTPDRDVYVTIGRIVVEIKMTAVCAEATSRIDV